MKATLILAVLTISFNLFGQGSYKWINYPSVIGILDEMEANTRDYALLEGKVKEIRQTSYFTPSKERKIETVAMYAASGEILSIQTTITDSISSSVIRFYSIQFAYDSAKRISSETITDIFEGDTIYNSEKRPPEYFASALPVPIASNELGDPKIIVLEEDTTFSFYDEYGRKTMDSIPYSKNIEGLKYKYAYHKDSVYCEHFWSANSNVPTHKEIFILDRNGNWIEKHEIGLFEIPTGEWSAIHRREIVYY